MIAVELSKSPGVALVEREKRVEIMEEVKFALSGLAEDTDRQVEVGKMLSADYLVFGEIVDMPPQLLISVRMTGVKSGKIVFREKLTEKAGNYEYISGFFASTILDHFDVRVAETTTKKTEEKREKNEEAVVAFSRALAAYDKGEKEEAKEELKTAKKIDPDYDAAQVYLDKLTTNTTKFKVKTEPFYSYQNPAYLGIIRTDNLHLLFGQPLFPTYWFGDIENLNFFATGINDSYIMEMDLSAYLGYAFPLGRNLGLRIDALVFARDDNLTVSYADHNSGVWSQRASVGAVIDAGWRISPSISLGLGVTLYPSYNRNLDEEDLGGAPFDAWINPQKLGIAGNVGFLYRNTDESFVFDSRIAWGNETSDLIYAENDEIIGQVMTPFYLENTVTFAFNQKRTFFLIKQLNDVSFDRVYYFGRILPAVEHFFFDWFSLRAGIEGLFSQLNDSSLLGYGVMGGVTFRIIPWGLDIDLNISYRLRPSRVIEEFLYPDLLGLISISLNDLFISRD